MLRRFKRRLWYKTVLLSTGICSLGLSAGIVVSFVLMRFAANDAQRYLAAGSQISAEQSVDMPDKPMFPVVDWESLNREHPEVVAWLSVPDTSVSLPIVAADVDKPLFYLTHDLEGRKNIYGCAYLDATCRGNVLAPNAVIYGHHSPDGAMFAPLSKYLDASWAKAHSQILLQTPTRRMCLRPAFLRVVNAAAEGPKLKFSDEQDFVAWYQEELLKADITLDNASSPNHVVRLVTCSYTSWSNERTVIYCIEGDAR